MKCDLHKKKEEPKPFDDLKAQLEDYMFLNKYVCYTILILLVILAFAVFFLICFQAQPQTYGFLNW